MSSSIFFRSELHEIKSGIYRVDSVNVETGLQWLWRHLFVLLSEETVHFTTDRVRKKQFVTGVCSQYPMLTLHFAGLRIQTGKSVIV